MKNETKAEMKLRLENEVSELKKQLKESYEREEKAYKEISSLKDNSEDNFKQTGLYKQMQTEISNLKSENSLNKWHIKSLEEIRNKQANRILELEGSIKSKNDTKSLGFEEMDSILLEIEDQPVEEIKKIETFNNLYANDGVALELLSLDHTYIKINFDTRRNRRNAGRKQKFVQGTYTLSDIEQMLKETNAEEVAMKLGISRTTFFRKLKKSRECGDPNERFL